MADASAGHAIVLADGDAPDLASLDASWPGWTDGVTLVVAADGGARHAAKLGLRIDRWVGDGDSIAPGELEALRATGVRVDLVAARKDETDTELALRAAVEEGARRITILGAIGGARLDHALANVALLAHPALEDRPAALLDGASRVRLLRGPAVLELIGRRGDLVSLIPFGGDALGVRTDRLEYPLDGETLPFGAARGVSNVRLTKRASVSLERGAILVVETPVTLSE
ncbi:MAG TPA: thiamine diphosphokinase [Candidatus Limnocylindrales bacterium]|nr:thiamine diphosphokinase [Candidatus Limnocylindrales bacterium]